jgi:hypothetical protein
MPVDVLGGVCEDNGVARPTCMDVGADRPCTRLVLDVWSFSKASSRGGPRARVLLSLVEEPEFRDAAEPFTDRPVAADISGFQQR